MKIETIQKFDYRVKLLKRMKDDYSFIRERILECEKNAPGSIELSSSYCDDCIRLIEVLIKFYSRKIERN